MHFHEALLFSERDGVATLTLHRPEVLNAFSGAMAQALSAAYRHCDETDRIRAVVLTGAGRAFCAGADLGGGAETFASGQVPHFSSQPLAFPAWRVRKPVIAAINGHALGIGLSLAMQTDMRFFARDGQYGFLQVRRGVLADGGMHWLLPRLIGQERALALLLGGQRLNGEQALVYGLGLHCLPAAEVLPAAQAWAAELATACAALPVALAKRLVWAAPEQRLDAAIDEETRALLSTMQHADAREGGQSWAEKRAPVWQGAVPTDWPQALFSLPEAE